VSVGDYYEDMLENLSCIFQGKGNFEVVQETT
jgi:hypothetical protein